MTKQKYAKAKETIDATCRHFGITKEEFFLGRCYKCSDARKITIAVLLDTGVFQTITEVANALNIERSTASFAIKRLKEYLPFNKILQANYDAVKNKVGREKSKRKTLAKV